MEEEFEEDTPKDDDDEDEFLDDLELED